MSPAATAARARATAPADSASAYERWSDAGRATLRLVATRPLTIGRLPFALLVGGILAAGLVALLLLHTLAAQDAFRLQDLQREQAQLADVEQELSLAQQQQEAPASLAARARALGMVPTGSIAFVKPNHKGKIIGVVKPAVAPAPVTPVTPAPTASPTAAAHSATHPGTHPATHRAAGQGGTGGTDRTAHHRRVTPKPGG